MTIKSNYKIQSIEINEGIHTFLYVMRAVEISFTFRKVYTILFKRTCWPIKGLLNNYSQIMSVSSVSDMKNA